jgi:2',3'-cyclic-nucleotide 2'-phosphodiesterase (5'-nucleotidase family)
MTKSILLSGAFICSMFVANAQTTVSLLHFNDLHAHLTPHKDIIRHGDTCATDANATFSIGERGGIARLKTLVTQLKTANPNSILMNIGDTYHGGVEAAYTSGNAIVPPVNALGIDVAVPGNWDFAYGPGVFRKRYTPTGPFPQLLNAMLPQYTIQTTNYPVIAANLTYKKLGPLDKSVDNAQVLPATMEITKGGVKIGFIGITSDIVPQMYAQLATGFNFFTGETYYTNLINTLATNLRANGCKMVCVMSELGIQKDYRLSQIITTGKVDVFFSAHTHELTFKPLQFNNTSPLVVEAGNDAWLGKMDVTFDNAGTIISKQWNLLAITDTIAQDASMLALVNTARAPFLVANPNMLDPMGTSSQSLNRPITDVAGFSNGLLTRHNALESSFNDALCKIMKDKAGTQLAITPGFRFDSPIANSGFQYEDMTVANGAITVEDIYRFYPVFYSLATAQITGDSLKKIMEKLLTNVFSQNAFNQSGGWVDGFAGVDANINLTNADNQKVLQMFYEGTTNPINGTDNLTVVGCVRPNDATDILCSHTGFTNKTNYINTLTGQPYTAIQLLEVYLATDTIPSVTTHHFTDAGNVAQWYQNPFVQPVYNYNCTPNLVLGIDDNFSSNSFSVYPNPTNGLVTITTKGNTLQPMTITIYNSIGQLLETHQTKESVLQFQLDSYQSGIYFIKINNNISSDTYKIIRN